MRADLQTWATAHRVRLVPKRDSAAMRAAARALKWLGNDDFLDGYWTTLGRTIYYPASIEDPHAHDTILEHEFVHVRQWERWGPWFSISYLLLPVPVGLAWFRWRWEREAYLVTLRHADEPGAAVDQVVERLARGYGHPWPRRWMRAWFLEQLRATVPPAPPPHTNP